MPEKMRWNLTAWALAICLLSACSLRTASGTQPAAEATPATLVATVTAATPGTAGATPAVSAPEAATSPMTSVTPASAAPGADLSGSPDALLPAGACLDLDTGRQQVAGSSGCDVSFTSGDDASGAIRLAPSAPASFAFGSIFWEPPSPTDCQAASGFSVGAATLSTQQAYYLCYQTGAGYFGWMHVVGYEPPALRLGWLTFAVQGPLPAEALLAATPSLSPSADTFTTGVNRWVRFGEGLDLDAGRVLALDDDGIDFTLSTGAYDPAGMVLSVLLQPTNGAGFQFSSSQETSPAPEDCQTGENFRQDAVQVDSLRRYVCYQTARGRMGYLYIHEAAPGVGLRVDWATWPEIFTNQVEAAAPTTPAPGGYRAMLVQPVPPATPVVYPPGRRFTHTWQIVNQGATAWSSRLMLVFAGGSRMGNVERLPIGYRVEPGKTLKITLNLAAPDVYGTFTGLYWLEDPEGNRFGVGEGGLQPLQVLINVGEPGLTLAEGRQVRLTAGWCFDLDLGYAAQVDPACDLVVTAATDPGMVALESPLAAFDFLAVLTTAPTLGRCRAARLSSGTRQLNLEGWYACYKTDEGRYGWLYVHTTNENALTFDWKTYR